MQSYPTSAFSDPESLAMLRQTYADRLALPMGTVTGPQEAEQIRAQMVGEQFFLRLRGPPANRCNFTAVPPGALGSLILNHTLGQRRFFGAIRAGCLSAFLLIVALAGFLPGRRKATRRRYGGAAASMKGADRSSRTAQPCYPKIGGFRLRVLSHRNIPSGPY
jgi:hypothetical protein